MQIMHEHNSIKTDQCWHNRGPMAMLLNAELCRKQSIPFGFELSEHNHEHNRQFIGA